MFCRSSRDTGSDTRSEAELYGYPTVMALATAVKEWLQLHEHTFNIIANLMVYIGGGVELVFGTPRALLVRVEARPGAIDSSPAFRFCMTGADIVHRDESSIVNKTWDTLMDGCRREAIRAPRKDPSAPWAGILPTVFYTASSPRPVISLTQYAVYRFQLEGINRTPLDPNIQAAFSDHVQLCAMSMSLGHIYSRSANSALAEGRFEPPVFQMVRSHKAWKRVPIEGMDNADEYWDTMAVLMVSRPEQFTSGLNPRELWIHFIRACFGSQFTGKYSVSLPISPSKTLTIRNL